MKRCQTIQTIMKMSLSWNGLNWDRKWMRESIRTKRGYSPACGTKWRPTHSCPSVHFIYYFMNHFVFDSNHVLIKCQLIIRSFDDCFLFELRIVGFAKRRLTNATDYDEGKGRRPGLHCLCSHQWHYVFA